MSDDLKSWHAESWHAGYHCRDHQVADLERMLRAEQSALTEQHAANARLQAERDALAEQLNSVTSMAERFGQERDALLALLREAREREQRYVLPLYRDANYLARIDAVLARVGSAKGE